MVNPEFKDILFNTIKNISDVSNNPNIKNYCGKNLEIEIVDYIENNFFSWNQNLISDNKILLANLKSDKQTSLKIDLKNHRQCCDMALLYLLFHDPKIMQQNYYVDDAKQKLFDNFEKTRLLLNIAKQYLGITKNIFSKINDDIVDCQDDLDLIALLPLKDIFNDWKYALTSLKVRDFEQKLDANLVNKINQLAAKSDDQESFAKLSQEIIELFLRPKDIDNKESGAKNQNQGLKLDSDNFDLKQDSQAIVDDNKKELKTGKKKAVLAEIEIKEIKLSDEAGTKKIESQDLEDIKKIEFVDGYKIFSNKFDEIVFPAKLLTKSELESLRLGLDMKLQTLNIISKRLILKLKKKLLAKKYLPLEYSQSEGVLNRKKLTQMILEPSSPDIWQNFKLHDYQDAIVAILIDNSGSMRGSPITMSALASEIIAATLEKFSIKSEILGFTTCDWRGGKSRKLWESLGSKSNPGRLNDLRHIVYKSANQNFKKSKINLGLMLKDGILKENIDSEALLWAKSRLMQSKQTRKILIVISDGAPIDDSTTTNNDNENILTDHLSKVISKIEKQSKIELVGIGIGHDVGQFYKNSIVIKNPDELGDVMIEKITKLL
jgi:cobaltochelatase CobT